MTVADVRYSPKEKTRAALAITFIEEQLRDRPRGSWVANTDVAKHLACRTNALPSSLEPAVAAGLLERSTSAAGFAQWRLAQPKPRRERKAPAPARFSIDWPPGFVSRFDSVKVPAWDAKVPR